MRPKNGRVMDVSSTDNESVDSGQPQKAQQGQGRRVQALAFGRAV
ncbi:hypothetical protein [Hymenobacter qilianensis]|nr:hypothetical protein [Hymenobacter qilianensis]